MPETKSDIITRLRKDIICAPSLKAMPDTSDIDVKLGIIRNAFYGNTFPVVAVHEFICNTPEDVSVTHGFISGILSLLMKNSGAVIWIGMSNSIFPPSLQAFGVSPDKVIFIRLYKEKEILWAMEEALKCEGIAAVVSEVKEISFTASRRLQLAVEQSKVTGFLLRKNPKYIQANAFVTRWQLSSLPSEPGDMPGVGFPRWNVELLKVRNGKPGSWHIEFSEGCFRQVYKMVSIPQLLQKKAG